MLKKERRIPKQYFPYILSKGKRLNSKHLTLTIAQNTATLGQKNRFCFSVSKKNVKLAVKRNLLRRRGYAVIGITLDDLKDGLFYWFTFKKGSESLSFNEMKQEIMELLSDYIVIK